VKDLVLVFINMDDALTSIALKKLYREGKHFKQYSLGLCPGLLQTNMVMIPSAYAEDLEKFCNKNSSACPLIYKSKIGEVSASFLTEDSDIRLVLLHFSLFQVCI